MWQIVPLVGISLWMGLFWRRANRFGAWASFIGATAALLIGHYVFGWHGDTGFPKIVLFYLSTGLVAGVAASLLTRPEPASAARPVLSHDQHACGPGALPRRIRGAREPAEVRA